VLSLLISKVETIEQEELALRAELVPLLLKFLEINTLNREITGVKRLKKSSLILLNNFLRHFWHYFDYDSTINILGVLFNYIYLFWKENSGDDLKETDNFGYALKCVCVILMNGCVSLWKGSTNLFCLFCDDDDKKNKNGKVLLLEIFDNLVDQLSPQLENLKFFSGLSCFFLLVESEWKKNKKLTEYIKNFLKRDDGVSEEKKKCVTLWNDLNADEYFRWNGNELKLLKSN
jgi:hypothetical protein